mgnify:FL=1
MLYFLDITLFVAHVIIIFFNLFGWVFGATRKLHLIAVSITLFSWVVLGFWKGFGYCILTDWHWDIKRDLGEHNLPHSFITYLTNNILGLTLTPFAVDVITGVAFITAILISIRLNFFSKETS